MSPGRRCQNKFSVCESQPCQNGGACSVSSSSPLGYTCTCQLVSLFIHFAHFNYSDDKMIVPLNKKTDRSALLHVRPQGYIGPNCERSMSCRELSCYNGGSCTLTSRGARCSCLPGYGGPQCQHRSTEGCSSKPCRNGGVCTEETSYPYFSCQCSKDWAGKRCEHKSLVLQVPTCPLSDCHRKANDSVCDKECNTFACRWDGGDCSLAMNPWANCTNPMCWRVFNNSQCDEACNNEDCLYDNFDCRNKEKVCKLVQLH